MKKALPLLWTALVVVGFLLVRAGERDDSPGLSGLGIMIALLGVWSFLRPLVARR